LLAREKVLQEVVCFQYVVDCLPFPRLKGWKWKFYLSLLPLVI
jgi:hypothetical protein